MKTRVFAIVATLLFVATSVLSVSADDTASAPVPSVQREIHESASFLPLVLRGLTPTPAPTIAPSPTPEPTIAPSPTPAPTVAPTPTPEPTPTTGPGLQIERSYLRMVGNVFVFSGEICNRGMAFAKAPTLTVTLYDAAEHVIAVREPDWDYIDHLYDGWCTPFLVQIEDAGATARHEIRVFERDVILLYPTRFLDLDLHTAVEESLGFWRFTGIVTNPHAEAAESAWMVIVGYDGQGRIVTVDSAFLEDVPGSTSHPFETFASFSDASRIDVVSWHRFVIDD